MRTAWRLLAVALVGALLAVPAPARAAIDDPPDTAGLSYVDSVVKLLEWCPFTRFELLPKPTGGLDLDGATLFVRKQGFVNASTASCDAGDFAPSIQLNLFTTVPALERLTLPEAQALLAKRALGLVVASGPTAADSLVAEQKPAAGTEIDIDSFPLATSTVAVILAAPPTGRVTVVPDLRTWREDDACAALTDRGLTCAVQATGGGNPPGTVLRQNPGPGFEVLIGTAVTLVVDRAAPEQPPATTPATDPIAEPDQPLLTPTVYATAAGLLVLVLIALLFLLRHVTRRPARQPLVTSARARLEPGGWQIEELPGRPNLTVAVRARLDTAPIETEESP